MKHDEVKKSLRELGVFYVVGIIVLKVIFHKTPAIMIATGLLKVVLFYFMPGLLLTYIISKDFSAMERYAFAFIMSMVILGIATYYAGIGLNIDIKYAPVISVIISGVEIGILCLLRKKRAAK